MTGATLEDLVESTEHQTVQGNDRYVTHAGAAESTFSGAEAMSDAWDNNIQGFSTITARGSKWDDANGKGYQLTDVTISLPDMAKLFTTATTTATTITTTTTTTNTVLVQLNNDLADLKAKLADNNVAEELGALIDSVRTLEEIIATEKKERAAADAKIAQDQAAGMLSLTDRLAALEASFKTHLTLPGSIRNAVDDMQSSPASCEGGSTCPPEVSAAASDLSLTAASGKVSLHVYLSSRAASAFRPPPPPPPLPPLLCFPFLDRHVLLCVSSSSCLSGCPSIVCHALTDSCCV
jgi:hypothetical protein